MVIFLLFIGNQGMSTISFGICNLCVSWEHLIWSCVSVCLECIRVLFLSTRHGTGVYKVGNELLWVWMMFAMDNINSIKLSNIGIKQPVKLELYLFDT